MAVAAGGDPQSNQTSVHLEEHVCTALRGKRSPKGPLYFWGTSALPPERAGRGGTRGEYCTYPLFLLRAHSPHEVSSPPFQIEDAVRL